MHPTEGLIRAYIDHELTEPELTALRGHLSMCPACRDLASTQHTRASQVQSTLAALNPEPAEAATSPRQAYTQFQSYIAQKEKIPMFQKLFTPRLRPAWAVLTLVIVVALFATLPPLRAIASDFLGLFRVQQVSVIPFDPLDLPQNFEVDQASITQMISEDLKYEVLGEEQGAATAAQASRIAGISVRLPAKLTSAPKLTVQQGMRLDFKVDLGRIQDILKEAGYGDIEIPAALDGANVKAVLPRIVTATYGAYTDADPSMGQDPDTGGNYCFDCTVLIQLASPEIETPEGVDLTAIGKAYLRLVGMTSEEAEAFSQTVDWSTTLVIPVPNLATHEVVSVDGVKGILIQNNPQYDTQYMLIWAKDGMVYALTGYDSREKTLEIANSLK